MTDTADNKAGAMADTVAGLAAGVSSTLIGHPFETLKVRMQTIGMASQKGALFEGSSMVRACLSTLKQEGLIGIYKGVTPTLPGVFAYNSVLFASFGQATNIFVDPTSPVFAPTVAQIAVAGALSAFPATLIQTPVEVIRCRLQTQYHRMTIKEAMHLQSHLKLRADEPPVRYTGALDVIKQTIKKDGLTGMYRGFLLNLAREVPGNLIYFSVYFLALTAQGYAPQMIFPRPSPASSPPPSSSSSTAILNPLELKQQQETMSEPGPVAVTLAGGFAGFVNWGLIYPVDGIKTIVQTDIEGKWRNGMHCARVLLFDPVFKGSAAERSQAIRHIYRGVTPCLVRGFAANGAAFLTLDAVQKYLYKKKLQDQ